MQFSIAVEIYRVTRATRERRLVRRKFSRQALFRILRLIPRVYGAFII